MDDLDRRLDRLRKLLALAASTVNAHESALAAARAVAYLDAHPLPVRWFVRKGTICHVAPSLDLSNLTQMYRLMRRNVPMHRDNWFQEIQRVKKGAAQEALTAGYLCYQRHGYTSFVPVKAVEVYL